VVFTRISTVGVSVQQSAALLGWGRSESLVAGDNGRCLLMLVPPSAATLEEIKKNWRTLYAVCEDSFVSRAQD
jgi:hypothetical protein